MTGMRGLFTYHNVKIGLDQEGMVLKLGGGWGMINKNLYIPRSKIGACTRGQWSATVWDTDITVPDVGVLISIRDNAGRISAWCKQEEPAKAEESGADTTVAQ